MKKWEELKFVNESEFNYIVEEYANNDINYGLDHIRKVINTAQIICKRINYPYNEIIELACLTHDMGVNNDNKEYRGLVARDIFCELFDNILCLKMADAIKIADCIIDVDKAIYEDCCKSKESSILAMSHAGLPLYDNKSLLDKVTECIKYYLEESNSVTEAFEKAKDHIKSKYGRHGYLIYSSEYRDIFKDLLEKQYILVDKL